MFRLLVIAALLVGMCLETARRLLSLICFWR